MPIVQWYIRQELSSTGIQNRTYVGKYFVSRSVGVILFTTVGLVVFAIFDIQQVVLCKVLNKFFPKLNWIRLKKAGGPIFFEKVKTLHIGTVLYDFFNVAMEKDEFIIKSLFHFY